MSETLTITTPDGDFSAYVARPEADKAPAILVIQEIFGVNKVMRDICDGLAAQGYVAVCPDLFWRIEPGIDITDQSEAEWKRAFELFNAFDVDTGVNDIAATIAAIRAMPGVEGKVGAVGYCLGGLLAFLTATRTDADAAVSYYGVGIEKHVGEAEKLNHPLLMHIAEKDQFVPPEAQQVILQALKDHPQIEIHTYPGRDHAFAREGGAHYDTGDAAKANALSLAFFKKALG
ncbi:MULTISPECIES: dienelactone hydrolase family protein [Caulobacter]|jgi:carboxymethylenebutenolidase|uniref:Dienelactone hydrolase-like enzyme n=1 Tax=Caulobacter vibrioides OR37 TaxID=1292034 RepID=R0EMZ4_CAUVI|nr:MULTISPECIES: dienelactone hydrolase family protein [Caulobacter]ENZ82457.1 dienelactone hydrolase-like enzyme [Caulobacter vibrioides OR37]MBQ1560078.1 dienelactone hydrolase family protein [Caulobacter sp.]